MRRVLLFCAFLILVTASPIRAQSTFRITPTVGASISSSPEAFSNFYSLSPQVGLGLEYFVSRNVGIHARFHYTRLYLSKDGITSFFDQRLQNELTDLAVSGPAGTILGGSVNLEIRTDLPRRLTFHGLIGLGLYRQSLYDVTVADQSTSPTCPEDCFTVESLTQTSPGISFGFRVSAPLTPRFRVFVEPQYVIILSEESADRQFQDQAFGRAFVGAIGYFPLQTGVSIGM